MIATLVSLTASTDMIISEVVFSFYTIALIGNIAIILLPLLDEHLQIPMYFFLRNLAILIFYTNKYSPIDVGQCLG